MFRPATHNLARQNLGRFYSQLLDGPEHSASRLKDDLSRGSRSGPLSVFEDPNHFRVSLDMSRLDETSLNLWVTDRQLTLTADERQQSFSKSPETSTAFIKCIRLPNDVDEDSIQAELKNAWLEIHFKKTPGSYPADF
jgi:HSP20 family molecular chaperone IbpA